MHLRRNKPSRNLNSQKRRLEETADLGPQFEPLLLENPYLPDPINRIVDPEKVENSLKKNITGSEDHEVNVRILLGNSEIRHLKAKALSSIVSRFELSSILVSDAKPTSIDRILSICGKASRALAATAYISYYLCADINNLLKSQSFTLKSQNYKIDILIESNAPNLDDQLIDIPQVDYASFDCNYGLYVATLQGDLSSLMSSVHKISIRFPFRKYAQTKDIQRLAIIKLHDHDYLFHTLEVDNDLNRMKKEILEFVYSDDYYKNLLECF